MNTVSSNTLGSHTNKSLIRSAGRGSLWQLIGSGWQTVLSIGSRVILARLLSPADFGIFGMALIARELIQQMGNMGMKAGIVAKSETTEEDLSTCFWSMAALRVFTFVLAFSLAPLVASFFQMPELKWVFRAVSLFFLFSIFGIVPQTLLEKELQFRPIILIRAAGALLNVSAALILVIYFDWNFWALVIGMVISEFFIHFSLFTYVNWRPKLIFNKESFKYLLSFGLNMQGFSILNYLHQNIDYLIVGRLLGATSMGFYEFAYRIPHIFQERLARPLSNIVFPSLSKLQHDDETLISGYLASVKYIALLMFPALTGLAVVAKPAVIVMWGEKWIPVVTPLQILCFCAMIRCVMAPIGSIFNVKKRPDLNFKIQFFRVPFTFVVVYILGSWFGINGVALGMLISTFSAIVPLYLAFKLTNTTCFKFFETLRMPLMTTIIVSSFAYIIKTTLDFMHLSYYYVLPATICTGILVFVLTIIFVFKHEKYIIYNQAHLIFSNRS